jgi:predicted transposase YbfD/YdcC
MDRLHFTAFLLYLKAVPDPRKARGKVFPWEFLLAIVCAAMLSGQLNGSAIAQWGADHWQEVAALLRIKSPRAPSHSTLRRALRYVDVEALERIVAEYNQALDREDQASGRVAGTERRPLHGQAIDGKELRGAGAHGAKVHLLSMVRHGSGVTLAQREVGEKTNEIPTVPELLARRDLSGTVVTLDALNTQRPTAEMIIEQGGDYLMVVKENQPTLYADIKTFFEGTFLPQEDDRDTYTYSGKDHGRLWTRTLTCSAGLDGYLGWPGAKQVIKRQCLRAPTKLRKASNEVTYAVSSLERERAGARQLEGFWRGHWTIENRVHYVRDVTLREDSCQIHKGNAPRALAALRNALLAALRHCGWENIAEALRYYGAFAYRALAFLVGNAFCQGNAQASRGCPGPP